MNLGLWMCVATSRFMRRILIGSGGRKDVTMRDSNLYAQIEGAGQAESIVFLPGFTGSHAVWNRDFQSLRDRYQLIFLDTLGFGSSPKPDIAYSLDDHLTAIDQTLRSFQIPLAHVVGHSMGCLLALAYARHYPERVATLALLALPCYRNEQEARTVVARSSLLNRLSTRDSPLAQLACTIMCSFRPLFLAVAPYLAPDVPAAVARDALRHTWPSYSRTLQHIIFEVQAQEQLQAIRRPTLIVQGTHDRIAPIENVMRTVDGLPNVVLKTLAADHRLIFTHSEEIVATIARFLEQSARPAESSLQLQTPTPLPAPSHTNAPLNEHSDGKVD